MKPSEASADTISLVVNGEKRTAPEGTTVTGLLEALDLTPSTVVVERNRRIVSRDDYPRTDLHDGDHLELVHFVGGG